MRQHYHGHGLVDSLRSVIFLVVHSGIALGISSFLAIMSTKGCDYPPISSTLLTSSLRVQGLFSSRLVDQISLNEPHNMANTQESLHVGDSPASRIGQTFKVDCHAHMPVLIEDVEDESGLDQ